MRLYISADLLARWVWRAHLHDIVTVGVRGLQYTHTIGLFPKSTGSGLSVARGPLGHPKLLPAVRRDLLCAAGSNAGSSAIAYRSVQIGESTLNDRFCTTGAHLREANPVRVAAASRVCASPPQT